MTEASETDVIERQQAVAVPPMRAIIAPPGNFDAYMRKLIVASHDAIEEAQRKVAKAEMWENSDELTEARLALAAADRLSGQEGHDQQVRWNWELKIRERKKKIRLAKARRALSRAIAMSDALQQGYVPLPTMPAVRMDFVYEVMPPDVLDAFTEAKEAGVFEEFRIIDGRDTFRNGVPTGTRSPAKRDPILVGVIDRELFAVAWWR